MPKLFFVLSGLPGSGKSTLARLLAPALKLPLIDKDTILEGLFERRGVGDARWRRALSRESDEIMEANALATGRAILVSFWRLAGMPADSGTPTDWLQELAEDVIHVHCHCDVAVAARRFFRRERHPGHLDRRLSYEDVLANLEAIGRLGSLDIGRRLDVDLSPDGALEQAARKVIATVADRCAAFDSAKPIMKAQWSED